MDIDTCHDMSSECPNVLSYLQQPSLMQVAVYCSLSLAGPECWLVQHDLLQDILVKQNGKTRVITHCQPDVHSQRGAANNMN